MKKYARSKVKCILMPSLAGTYKLHERVPEMAPKCTQSTRYPVYYSGYFDEYDFKVCNTQLEYFNPISVGQLHGPTLHSMDICGQTFWNTLFY